LCFKIFDEIANDRALLGWIELNDPNIANRCLASFLLEAKWQPNCAQLDCFTAATFNDASLCQRLGDLQALAFQRVSRNHIDAAESSNTRGNCREVVHVAPETDVLKDLATQLFEGVGKYLGVADTGVGVLMQQDCRLRVYSFIIIGRKSHPREAFVGHNWKSLGVAWAGDFD